MARLIEEQELGAGAKEDEESVVINGFFVVWVVVLVVLVGLAVVMVVIVVDGVPASAQERGEYMGSPRGEQEMPTNMI